MTEYINWNGTIVDTNSFTISPNNRGFKYGDGFFETMKVSGGVICLEALHFERLFSSLELLKFEGPEFYNPIYFKDQVQLLLKKNHHTSLARVRLMVFRGDGLYNNENNQPNFVIQSCLLDTNTTQLNNNGLMIDIYKDARKSCDLFSSVKSNNYLCYGMATLFAKKSGLDDALVLNNFDRVADSSIANVFIVRDGIIKTPPLSEGCIGGVYRRYLLQSFKKDSIPFKEEKITIEDLLEASEVFLTNAIRGIKWVSNCSSKAFYKNDVSSFLHGKYSLR